MTITGLSKLKISGFKGFKAGMPKLQIGNSVAKVPIVQGGMGVGISLSGLASAVANEGGIGVIAANAIGMLEPDYYTNGKEANKRALRKQIRIARSRSNGIIGVNLMVAVNDFNNLLQVSIEEKVDMVFLGAGLPLKGIPVEDLRNAQVKVIPIVSSARAAKLIFRYWHKNYNTIPDAVVVEGPKAGGHLGFKVEEIDDPKFALENIIPAVVKEIKTFEELLDKSIPVIAAGGIFTGEDIYKFFNLGAGGVQMASRFVATHECDADNGFKEAYINSTHDDITLIKSPVGLPGRAIKNTFLHEVTTGERKVFRCPWRCLGSCNAKEAKYCISEALNNARQGILTDGFAFAGTNAPRIKEILHVEELVSQLEKEYFVLVEKNTVSLRNEFEESFQKLVDQRDQYLKTLKISMKNFNSELGEMVEKGTAAVREEYATRLDALKEEYASSFEKVNELKDQLSHYLDTSSLNLPTFNFGF